jgi:hypothetical protein
MARNADLSDISGEKTKRLECCRGKNLVSPGWQLIKAVEVKVLNVQHDRLSCDDSSSCDYRQHQYLSLVWPVNEMELFLTNRQLLLSIS